jgi:hypothetical protein
LRNCAIPCRGSEGDFLAFDVGRAKVFLAADVNSMVLVDFFTVPTIRFQILYVFLVLAHERRRIVHFAATAHPTAEWSARQLREAFPWDTAPRLVRKLDLLEFVPLR